MPRAYPRPPPGMRGAPAGYLVAIDGRRTTVGQDGAIGLWRQGYGWASGVRAGRPATPVRFLGRRSVVVGGPVGVRRFYDPRLRRAGAIPMPVGRVLFGQGSVHGLDDEQHHRHKARYLDLLTPAAADELRSRTRHQWEQAARTWEPGRPFVLFDEAVRVLTATMLPWAGIPAGPDEVSRRARQLAAVLDGFARPGPSYALAATARRRLDHWAAGLIRAAREGGLRVPPGSPLDVMAQAREPDGRLPSPRAAGVALLNVVRPAVAVAWFVAFAGVALVHQPYWRERIAAGDDAALRAFAHEVRRRYPFVPVLAARARTGQDVLGVDVPAGGYVVLDVHGTDHDPAHWPDPDRFDPGRFLGPPPEPGTLVPQGGGALRTGHRCPGEDVTLVLLEEAVRRLALLPLELPEQDLTVDLARVPTRPRSGVLLSVAP
ncbi:cytochrome P450 [Jiangella rhizosphaerae]|uniref:Cytochrome P450 n=1 Tax=Jiangella rhizosphaerae TaxID=2293569 RepID=A0A418KPW8_9ACTN|nr:cytochrome P450 [Jiangella rhizosphaerae]RIQ21476.1 cytochrome P450 [Jiangella rhizosphaerae]